MGKNLKRLYEFGPFRLDRAERLLLRGGEVVPLTPKAFDVLLALVEQAGHLLGKEELLKTVWPDSFVEESNLADNVSRLRKALGDGDNGQKFIETVPRRGYRFVAGVKELSNESAAPPERAVELPSAKIAEPLNQRKRSKLIMSVSALLLLAHVGLADAYSALALSVDMPATEFYPKAKSSAEKAIEIDDRLAEAHASLGFAILFYDWDWSAAESRYKRALELNPNSAETHVAYAGLFTVLGRYAEGLAEIRRARELDPLNLRTNALEGRFLLLAGRTDEGLARLRKTIELEPNYFLAHLFASNAYIEKGMYSEAVAEATRARDLSGGNAEAIAMIGYALAISGKREEARALLDELKKRSTERYVPPYNFALIHNGLGERDEVFAWLARGVEQRDPKMIFLKGGLQWKNLRDDPRFVGLLERMELPIR